MALVLPIFSSPLDHTIYVSDVTRLLIFFSELNCYRNCLNFNMFLAWIKGYFQWIEYMHYNNISSASWGGDIYIKAANSSIMQTNRFTRLAKLKIRFKYGYQRYLIEYCNNIISCHRRTIRDVTSYLWWHRKKEVEREKTDYSLVAS
jgi:hypothetical protein